MNNPCLKCKYETDSCKKTCFQLREYEQSRRFDEEPSKKPVFRYYKLIAPYCPNCGSRINLLGADNCNRCGQSFDWGDIEIEEGLI